LYRASIALAPVFFLALAVAVPSSGHADGAKGHITRDVPEHHAEDRSAAAVTADTLLENERFWPWRVTLLRPWKSLRAEATGVLIRVEPEGVARIDFGRDGVHEVPISGTDLVERTNGVRMGDESKLAPNLVRSLAPRLIDSAAVPPGPLGFGPVMEADALLCVIADPQAESFAALAAQLAPLRTRAKLLIVLLPIGDVDDPALYEKLRALGWPVPFVYDHLSESYAHSILADGIARPAVVLQTPEGRILFQDEWSSDAMSKLTAAIDAHVKSEPVASRPADDGSRATDAPDSPSLH
jgi:hypothetical protein